MSRMVSGSLVPRPLRCSWGFHKWSPWTKPRGYKRTEERKCQRRGCTAVERRDELTKESVR
jgi:hypothetical protein